MSIQEVSAGAIGGNSSYHYHQALGPILAARARQTPEATGAGSTPGKKPPGCGCSPGHSSELAGKPDQNRRLRDSRHFAKPGEAEWGC